MNHLFLVALECFILGPWSIIPHLFVSQIDVTEAVVAQRELQLALTQLAEDKVCDGQRADRTMHV